MRSIARLLAAVVAFTTGSGAFAHPTEYQLKAVFLLNFARYVEWPEGKLSVPSIEVCVLGRDPFGGALDEVAGRQAQGREVHVRRVEGPDEARECHVVFMSASEERRVAAALRVLDGEPVLTVSDIEGFVEAGGGIGFTTVDERIRFDVNAAALRHGGLRASARMMGIARNVIGLGGAR